MSTEKTPFSQESIPQTLSTDYVVMHEPVISTAQPHALPTQPQSVQNSQASIPETLPSDYPVAHNPIISKPTSIPQITVPQTLSTDYSVSHNTVTPQPQQRPVVKILKKIEKEEDDEIEAEVGTKSDDEETGETLNPFLGTKRLPPGAITLGSFLDQGAFGQVYRGDWGTKPVALKKIDMEQAKENFPHLDESEILESLQWEISRLSTLSHPNLVQFYGVYEEASQRYLVMEFCEGGTLQSTLEKDQLSWSYRWQWALEITRGLAYLHEQGVLHRDLKAENILLDRYGRAKLADLGVAQVDALLQGKEAHVVEVGLQDRKFIAPETIANPNISNKKTDVYALGFVFWQLATGKVPRRLQMLSEAEKQAWIAGQSVRESIPSDCPEVFKNLILGCWHVDPQKRLSVDRLLENLQNLTKTQHKETSWLSVCDALDELLHTQRLEGLFYIAPYLTASKVEEPIETYWQRWETQFSENTVLSSTLSSTSTLSTTSSSSIPTSTSIIPGNVPLDLNQTLQNFISHPGNGTLLLLGDSGLGKSLSVALLADKLVGEWRLHRQSPKNQAAPSYLPLLLRPVLKRWAHSELNQSFIKVIDYYGLQGVTTPLLLIIDGYDECQQDIAPQNLAVQLGIPVQATVKLVVTCRSETVDPPQLNNRFALQGQLETRYFLPFNIKQVLNYLNDRLAWAEDTRKKYQETLSNISAVRTVLRNPFVLSLLVQSWETIAKQDFNQLNRWRIYEGFVAHWLTTRQTLLPTSVRYMLKGSFTNLSESFAVFASEVAFTAFEQKSMGLLTYEQIKQFVQSPWLNLETSLIQDAHQRFLQRQLKLTETQKRRALLTEEDYLQIMLGRGQQFGLEAPLKAKALGYEFTHKSFFEYFTAKRLLQWQDKEHSLIVREALIRLNTRSLQEESEVLVFAAEGWRVQSCQALIAPLFDVTLASRENAAKTQAASNAATLLGTVRVPFSGHDLSGVCIPGADLSNTVLDHTNLSNTNLTGVNLSNTWLRNTNFRYAQMQNVQFSEQPYLKHESTINAISYSHNGKLMATASDNKIHIWDCITSNELTILEEHSQQVNSLHFSVESDVLASGASDGVIGLWNLETKECRKLKGHMGSVTSVHFSPNQQYLVSGGSDGTLRLWDTIVEKEIHIFRGHTEEVTSVQFRPDAQVIASGSDDKTIRIWDIKTQDCSNVFKIDTKVYAVCFSLDRKMLAAVGADKTIRLWDLINGQLRLFKEHTGTVYSLHFSPDSKILASAGSAGNIFLWDVENGQFKILVGHSNLIKAVHFTPDGKRLASGGWDQTLRVWIINSNSLWFQEGHTDWVNSVCFNSKKQILASGSHDKTIRLWGVTNGHMLSCLSGHTDAVYGVCFSNDGKKLASASIDKTIRVWDIETGQFTVLKGHNSWVNSVFFSPDGKTLVSGSGDKTIRLWDIETGQSEVLKKCTGDVRCIVHPFVKTIFLR